MNILQKTEFIMGYKNDNRLASKSENDSRLCYDIAGMAFDEFDDHYSRPF